jgi:hypothetical protein
MLKKALKLFSQRINLIILILLGSISWSWTMVKSGWQYSYGLGFWGANGHDGVWHIALSESLSRGLLNMPVFAGASLQNYHIGFDLILALLHKIAFIPTSVLYFQILPPIFALLIGLLTYVFTLSWTKSSRSAWWSTFFVYFGGSFGWVIGKGESVFWSQQAISTLVNPPLALSLIFLLLGLILIKKLDEKFTTVNFILSILVFGTLIEIKAYAGIMGLGALFVSSVYSLFIRKNINLLKVFVGAFLLSLVLYLPLNKNSTGLLVLSPFWFLETMMGTNDRVDWQKFYSAMMTYKSGGVFVKGILAYGVAFVVFILGNFGTRIIFLFRKIKIDKINIFIYSIIGAGVAIPMLFLQKGTPWNTIQFFYYSLFFSSILAGIVLSKVKSKIIILVVVLATIPTTFITLKDVFVPSRPPAMLPLDELAALSFLSKQPDGVVLTKPFDFNRAKAAENNPPRPLYLYTSTAYVSAFSKQQTFLEDEINIDITGYSWKTRKDQVLEWYESKDVSMRSNFLIDNDIKYIYWLKEDDTMFYLNKLSLTNIFENNLVIVYRVE